MTKLKTAFAKGKEACGKGIYYLLALALIGWIWWMDAGIVDGGFDTNLAGIKLLAKLEPYGFWTKAVSFLRFINVEKFLLIQEAKWAIQLVPVTVKWIARG